MRVVRDLDAEQPDAQWLNEESERRREIFLASRASTSRQDEPLWKRIRDVEVAIALTSHMPAAKIGGEPPSGDVESSGAPPYANELAVRGADPVEVHRLLRLVGDAVEQLERLLEPAWVNTALAEEKDREILSRYADFTAEEVAALRPDLGDAKVIKKVRSRECAIVTSRARRTLP